MCAKRYENRVSTGSLPGVRLSANATADSFGGQEAAQLKKLSDSGVTAGAAVFRKLETERLANEEILKKATARDLYSQAQLQSDTILFGDGSQENTGVYSLKGIEASNALATVQKSFEDVRKKSLENVQDPKIKQYFDAMYTDYVSTNFRGVLRFQSQQIQKYNEDTILASNKNLIENSVSNRTVPETVTKNIQDIKDNTAFLYKGMGKEVKDNKVAEAVHAAHSEVFEALKNDSPTAAKAYLEDNEKEMQAKYVSYNKEILKDLVVEEEAFSIAGQLMATGASEADIYKEVNNIKDADLAKAIRSELDYRYTKKRNIEKAEQDKVVLKAWDELDRSGTLSSIPNFYSLPAAERIKMKEYISKKEANEFVPDVGKYEELYRMALNDPKKFADLQLSMYRGTVGKEQYNKLVTLQQNAIKSDSDYLQAQTFGGYVTSFIQGVGIPTGDKANAAQFKNAGIIRSLFENEVNKYPADQRDLISTWNKVSDELLLEYDTKGFQWNIDTPRWKAQMSEEGTDVLIKPESKPVSVPKSFKFVNYTLEDGTRVLGWEGYDEEGQKYLYSPTGQEKRPM